MGILFKLFRAPIAGMFGAIGFIRRLLYQSGLISRYEAPIQVISIGNLRFGGTGKTPLVEFLAHKYIHKSKKVAVLSRGYKRKIRGYLKVNQSSVINDVGDEALQLFEKVGAQVSIHVCENRATGIERILANEPEIEMILLDDAFQHLSIKPTLNILLTTFDQPFFGDHIFPLGRLRESRSAAIDANLTIVTKCPHNLKKDQVASYTLEIERYSPDNQIVFSEIKYLEPISIHKGESIGERVILLTGIANPQSIINHVTNNYELLRHFFFADHHNYTASELSQIFKYCNEKQCSLLTTSKDIVKLTAFKSLQSIPVFVQPIEIQFLFDGENVLEEMIAANQ